MKGGSENHLTDQLLRFGQWSNITLFLSVWSRSLVRKIHWRYEFSAGRVWKRDVMVADIEELEEMDASELHARRLHAKESVNANER